MNFTYARDSPLRSISLSVLRKAVAYLFQLPSPKMNSLLDRSAYFLPPHLIR